ncbi:MAG TPA: CPBP family intramembrane metalloprotease [Clostridiaceae bacterium]|nr:CPBP family intramembrane metalloprotease [Clostridiaceae bacterium]
MKKKIAVNEIIFAAVLTLSLAALDLTILPASLFVYIQAADIEPIYISLIINQWLLIIIGLIAIRYLCPNLVLGLKITGLKTGLKKYLPSAIIMLAITTFAYFIGLLGKYDYTPTVWKVLVEIFIYNVSVGFIEELYIRGLLLAILIYLLRNKKNAVFQAIIISSVMFSLGHIPGMISAGAFAIAMRLIWTFMLGVYLAVIYKQTDNLWVSIIIHALLNVSGISFCFTTSREFPQISVIIIMIGAVIIALWSVWDYFKSNDKEQKTGFIAQA